MEFEGDEPPRMHIDLDRLSPNEQFLYDRWQAAEKERDALKKQVQQLTNDLAYANKKWQDYEREYLSPTFRWAKDAGIDLQKLMLTKKRNCVELIVITLREQRDEAAARADSAESGLIKATKEWDSARELNVELAKRYADANESAYQLHLQLREVRLQLRKLQENKE